MPLGVRRDVGALRVRVPAVEARLHRRRLEVEEGRDLRIGGEGGEVGDVGRSAACGRGGPLGCAHPRVWSKGNPNRKGGCCEVIVNADLMPYNRYVPGSFPAPVASTPTGGRGAS